MPPRKPPASRTAAKKATPDRGVSPEDAALAQREHDAAQRSGAAARGVRLQKLDADGAPVGEPVRFDSTTTTMAFTPDDSGIDLAFEKAFDASEKAFDARSMPEEIELEFTDPAAVEILRRAARIPIPTAVIAEWFPAYFRPVEDPQPWATCKVFLTPQGLYVYRTAPEGETVQAGAQPNWYAGVDFVETAKPVTGYAAQNAGIPITTSAGKVNVQPYGGCGCSARKLKNWTPSWARNRISWADAVQLANPTAGR